jgi:hypothetical protein
MFHCVVRRSNNGIDWSGDNKIYDLSVRCVAQ